MSEITRTMKKDRIKEVLELMSDSIEADKIELYKKLIDEKCFENINDIDEFYFGLVYPHDQFLHGLIMSEISIDKDVAFILKHSQFIDSHFLYWIEKTEGSACCADKSRNILRQLVNFYKTGERIEFDYTQEYTFHLPKSNFTTHEIIIEFYEGLKGLNYGNPTKYLSALKSLI